MSELAEVDTKHCYCVCHSPISSKAWCEHCKGDNPVGRVPRCVVPDDTNAYGTCARALPCPVHDRARCPRNSAV